MRRTQRNTINGKSIHEQQKELIEYAMTCVEDEITETFGNANKNGNALYEVIRQWAAQKT